MQYTISSDRDIFNSYHSTLLIVYYYVGEIQTTKSAKTSVSRKPATLQVEEVWSVWLLCQPDHLLCLSDLSYDFCSYSKQPTKSSV